MDFLNLLIVLLLVSSLESTRYDHGDHSHPTISRDKPSNFLRDNDVLWDKEHIKEDIRDTSMYDLDDDASNQELAFHYFMLHDLDRNGKLDGLELLAALNHVSHQERELRENPEHEATWLELQQLHNKQFDSDASIIDVILEQDDVNNDGFLTYLEFAVSRQQ